MNPIHVLLFISFLIMCKLDEAIPSKIPDSSPAPKSCSNFIQTSLDTVNITNFRLNLKLDLYKLNCTQPSIVNFTVADLENPKNGSFFISTDSFCATVQNVSWRNYNLSSFNHLVKTIFNDKTLCAVVCTLNLNKTIWPYCELIRNITIENISVKHAEPQIKTKNKTLTPSTDSHKGQIINPAHQDPQAIQVDMKEAFEKLTKEDAAANDKLDTDQSEEDEPQSSKQNLLQEKENTLNKSEHPPPPVSHSESKKLPRIAIDLDLGKTNLKPENDESHYFMYFVVISILCILCYIGIYNKKKILALMIEGRKQRDRRRNTSAGYRKLNTNLEEVMPLGTSAPASDSIIY